MDTIIENIWSKPEEIVEEIMARAAEIIKRGGLVAFPTETVYGLGANALDPVAAKKIYAAKGRPSNNPLIVHVTSLDNAKPYVLEITETARKLSDAFWPGAMTLIMKKSALIPNETSGGLATVGIRVPSNNIARRLIEKSGVPIAAPSANASGRPSTTEAAHVITDLSGKVDMIIDGGSTVIGLESTIIDITGEIPAVLRPGSISISDIEAAIGNVRFGEGIFEPLREGAKILAPGMMYKHYAPVAKMTLFEGSLTDVVESIISRSKGKRRVGVLASDETVCMYDGAGLTVISAGSRNAPETIGANLFKCLRDFDALGVDEIYSETFLESHLGAAIMNRLYKASGYNIIKV